MLMFYNAALKARTDYIFDIRMAVWSEGKELEKYIKGIIER